MKKDHCIGDYAMQLNRYSRHEEVTKQVTAGMGQP